MGSSTIFTGASSYSQDFIQVIERSMAIARLPLLQLQQQRVRSNDQQTAMADLHGRFQSLKLAFDDLAAKAGRAQLNASVSASGFATATVGEGAQKGTFTLDILNMGRFTSYLSATAVADPNTDGLGTELTKVLVVDGVETELTLAGNSLKALADGINAAGVGLQASIINVSGSATASYKLVLQGGKLGAQTIEVRDGNALGANLLEASPLQAGENVSYRVNGVSVSGESRNVALAPGVSVQLQAVTTASLTVTVSRDANAISSALQSMVAVFNQAASKLNEHRGAGTGALQGSSTVQSLGQLLRRVTGYSAAEGTYTTASAIGLSFDDRGTLSFDSSKLAGLSETELDSLLQFLGTEKGKGFAGAAIQALEEATNPESGMLQTERNALSARLRTTDNQIQDRQERLGRMEKDLRDRFAVVDSTIAALQQQALFINNMFEAMRISQRSYSR